MVGCASTAGNLSHRWDAKSSVAGVASGPSSRGSGAKIWRGGGAFNDPNKRDGVAPHAVAGASTRLIDVYEAPLRRVDELLGVRVDEFTPKLGYATGPRRGGRAFGDEATSYRTAPRLWPESATFVSGYEASYSEGASTARFGAAAKASFGREPAPLFASRGAGPLAYM